VKNGLGIQIEVAHDRSEEFPLRLRKCEKQVFVANRGVLPTPSVFDRAVHQPLRGFTNLAGSDVEIFQGERASWPPQKQDWVQAISLAMRSTSWSEEPVVSTLLSSMPAGPPRVSSSVERQGTAGGCGRRTVGRRTRDEESARRCALAHM
jgi:hypothetical protein